jgi:hypothetical protein
MKHKLKNKMQQVEPKLSPTNIQPTKTTSWEMSAQDALRIDYVTPQRNLSARLKRFI